LRLKRYDGDSVASADSWAGAMSSGGGRSFSKSSSRAVGGSAQSSAVANAESGSHGDGSSWVTWRWTE